MRSSNLKRFERNLARGAALALIGGLAAGCSSNTMRFEDGIFSGLTPSSNRQVASASSQPYPGDNLDRTSTGSVRKKVVRPQVPVGPGGRASAQPQGNASQPSNDWSAPSSPMSTIRSEPLPAPDAAGSPGSGRTASTPQQLSPQSSQPQAGRGAEARDSAARNLTIQQGETVYNLSRRFNVPVAAILAANNMSSGAQLQSGQTIVIPSYAYSSDAAQGTSDVADAKSSAPEPERKAPAQPASGKVAVLPQTPKTREAAEEGKGDGRSVGTRSGAGAVHTVSSGDTLYGISKQTGVSVDRLKAANGLSDGTLHVGQKLTIPGAGESAEKQVAKAGSETEKVDATTTSGTAPAANARNGEKEPRKVSSYTPPKDDAVGEQSKGEEVASLPNSTGVGRLRWPVDGRVINGFGAGSGPSSDGIDVAVPDGTPVKAAENGVVIYSGDGLKEFGNTVLVRHEDGLVTVYGHASKLEVKRGDTVKRGQTVALSGMSGNADRPKLHFEVRKDSAPVDPSKYLN